jgi:hypothetical protein
MHALARIRLPMTLASLSVVSVAHAGDSTAAPSTTADPDVEQAVRLTEAQEPDNAHAYRDIPRWRSAPAAGTEFGLGVVVPSLHVPVYAFQGRLGVALETSSRVAFLLEGMTGITVGFNTGGSSTDYGYLVRVPLMFTPEIVYSRLVDYRNKRFMNFHFGLGVGGDFVLAAQCLQEACNYITPSVYFALGARAGLSFSAYERSAVGLFVSWQNDFAPCPPASQNCSTALSTFIWSVGWSLF